MLPPLIGYWMCRRRIPWKVYLTTSQQSDSNLNLGRAFMSKVGLSSLWCGPHTGASGGPWCRHIRSACRDSSGGTALGSTCSYRRADTTPNLAQLPPQTNPHIYWPGGLIWHIKYKESTRKHLFEHNRPYRASGRPIGYIILTYYNIMYLKKLISKLRKNKTKEGSL